MIAPIGTLSDVDLMVIEITLVLDEATGEGVVDVDEAVNVLGDDITGAVADDNGEVMINIFSRVDVIAAACE
ncbi:hypothetical protein DID88_001547 [Monilinia fructigena]|uniref:Uncharacterized protein n=1 Tax=Monilinia fructigena TaxID=38457 RepID=A0A395IXF2_9HELO|nr:hypothetical protein DID88_001547 [Monilinia fructigena]